METQNHQTEVLDLSQTIERIDTSDGGASQVANKICGGAPCGFSDAASTSKDAKERYASMKKLMLAVILCIIFMSVEVVGGIKANSLAILTDAAHLLSDVASFAISLFSLWAAGWEATPRLSYGFFRIEILGALVSIQLIWLLTGILVYEAFDRLVHDSGEVQGFLMFVVAAFGLIVNIIMTVMLGHEHAHGGHSHDHGHHGHVHEHTHHNIDTHNHHDITISTIDHHGHHDERQPLLKHSEDTAHHGHHGHVHEHTHHNIDTHNHHDITISTIDHHGHHDERQPLLKHSEDTTHSNNFKKERNINVQGAYLHVLGDLIQSAGVMIGGAFIWYKPEWKIIDLICTLIFSLIVLWTTIRMLRNILEVLMESTPREIDATRLEKGLCEMDDVIAVHEMHIWAITVGKVLLSCHVTITSEADATLVLDKVIGYIKREYNISHVTIQIERE